MGKEEMLIMSKIWDLILDSFTGFQKNFDLFKEYGRLDQLNCGLSLICLFVAS